MVPVRSVGVAFGPAERKKSLSIASEVNNPRSLDMAAFCLSTLLAPIDGKL